MLHFPDHTNALMNMTKSEKNNYLANVDLSKCNFEIKIADFGFSKKLK